MHFLIFLAFLAAADSRAVNISNTWVLPEEGFPVFYRYFRDRISWYEADAVCQFHHANLVTVDTTAQYDAVRAYLRELDISSAVWVGLIRSNPEGDFTWTDYRGLSGDGYWSSAPDPRIAPLCAAADPTADYRWEARACGGPTVASFICELPVPQWALGNEGCMVRALPALTILYLPETAAVQLTADCGLAGVKRLQCTGNVKREDLLKDLSCVEEVESTNLLNNTLTTSSVISDAPTTYETLETTSSINTEDSQATDHDILSFSAVSTTFSPGPVTTKPTIPTVQPTYEKLNDVILENNINLHIVENNNLQSNDIPNLVSNDNFLTNYRKQKLEEEEIMQHKKLHDELARLGNFETIFTQPTDHFVPPLVIAKARLNNDMTELSLKEKHAQYFGIHNTEHEISKEQNIVINESATSTNAPSEVNNVKEVNGTERTKLSKDDLKKEDAKLSQKKYLYKDLKSNNFQKTKIKKLKTDTYKENASTPLVQYFNSIENASTTTAQNVQGIQNDDFIDLTVTFREVDQKSNLSSKAENDSSVIRTNIDNIEFGKNESSFEIIQQKPHINIYELNQDQMNRGNNSFTVGLKKANVDVSFTTDGLMLDIVINGSVNFNENLTTKDTTTKMPLFKDDLNNSSSLVTDSHIDVKDSSPIGDLTFTTENTQPEATSFNYEVTQINLNSSLSETVNSELSINDSNKSENEDLFTIISANVSNNFNANVAIDHETYSTYGPSDAFNISDNIEEIDNKTEDLEEIDDLNSPLLSGANEPLQKPMRSRRPKQPPNRINKFNPFRILG